ncbi:hypothetical protein OQA88_2580 [Cercophora sp. LCS_1]
MLTSMITAFSTLAILTSQSLAAATFQTRALRGGVDVDEACRVQYGGNYRALKLGDYCDGWKCDVDGRHRGINMDMYCVSKYGGDALAKCADGWFSGVFNWECHDRT